MRLDKLFVTVSMCCLVILAGIGIIADNKNTYDIGDEDTRFDDVENIADDIYNESVEMRNKMLGNPIDSEQAESSMFTGAILSVPHIWNIFIKIPELLYETGEYVGIPGFVMVLIVVMLIISVVFSLLYTFWRFMPRD